MAELERRTGKDMSRDGRCAIISRPGGTRLVAKREIGAVDLSCVRKSSVFVESFRTCAGVCGIVSKAATATARAEFASAIRHFKNCKGDSRGVSIHQPKCNQVIE
ncbi:hypothetical protein [Burkholderia territorii]|uniref:Uncharacterized protein n=1 Tax=Burkholderia territorii TaxID=1503055 RepID=A0A6L3NN19_9BURK|nr:hypothetical protein [Burkholderia territorii]KAB0686239.1 hypothetical protein F7R13_01465 [Burkholderia territorii]MBM2773431.1 hypothetical protein [Burkholderia territorii]